MSLCVSLFIISIVSGPGGAPLLFLEAGAGLFFGLTMRQRYSHWFTIALGVACGGLALELVMVAFSFLSGGPAFIVRSLRVTYTSLLPLVSRLFVLVRLGNWWRHSLFPLVDGLVQWGLQNWLLLLYIAACMVCLVLVPLVYLVVNFFLRLLGYPVRPFPGERLESLLFGCLSLLLKLLPTALISHARFLQNLKRELRLRRIRLARSRRLAREGKR
jgi:hypothetical protein